MTVRNIKKSLAGVEDLASGIGTLQQERGVVHRVNVFPSSHSYIDMQQYEGGDFFRLYGSDVSYTDYRRNPTGTVGIPADAGGVWEPLTSNDKIIGGNTIDGAYLVDENYLVWHAASGSNYAWTGAFPRTVAPGVDPTAVGSGYVPRTDAVLRSEVMLRSEVGMRRFTSTQAPSQSYYDGEIVYLTDVGYVFKFKSSRYLIDGQSASEITFNDSLHILVTAGGMLQFAEFDKLRSVQSANTARFAAAIKDRTTPVSVDCYGDSITFGQALADTAGATNKIGSATGFGDGSTHEHWQFNANYPQWVASYLDDNLWQSSSVNNYGYSGDRAISGYLRHRVVSGSLAATIMYGINDCLFATSSGVNPEHLTTDPLYYVVHYQEALRLFAAKQILQGKCVTILSTTPYGAIAGFDGTQLAAMKLTRAYNAAAKQVAAEFGCRYVDMTQDVFNQYGIMEITQEATHLGDVGLKIAGERIASALVLVETENRVCHGSVLIANPGINVMLSKDAINVLGNSTSSTPPGALSSNPSCVNVSAEWVSIPFYAETDGLVAFVNGVASGTPPIGAEIKLDFGAVQSNYHYQHSYLSGKPVAEKSLSLLPQPFKRDNQNISNSGSAILVVANRGWHTLSIRKVSGSLLLDSISFEALESVLASDVYGVTASCSVSGGVLDSGARNIASVVQDYPGEFSIYFVNSLTNNKYTVVVDVSETSADPVTAHSRGKGLNAFSLAFNKWNGTAWVKFVPSMFTVKVIGGR